MERQGPQYVPIVWRQTGMQPRDLTDDTTTHEPTHDEDLVSPIDVVPVEEVVAESIRPRIPLKSARTFPLYNSNPWLSARRRHGIDPASLASEYGQTLPTLQTALDRQQHTYRLQAPIIYACRTGNLPRYQLKQEVDRTGKPCGLLMRRLRLSEMRAYSTPGMQGPKVAYDDSATLFSITLSGLQGCGESDLEGRVQVTSGRTLWGGVWTKMWHVHRAGGRNEEWNEHRQMLYSVRKGVWEDGEGTVVGREEKGKVLEVSWAWGRDAGRRDLVVACWVMRAWLNGEVVWSGR